MFEVKRLAKGFQAALIDRVKGRRGDDVVHEVSLHGLEKAGAAGLKRGALDDFLHFTVNLVPAFYRGGADEKFGLGVFGDDVRRIAAFGDDAVDADILGKLLTQQADGVEDQDHRVKRIDALSGCGGCMGGTAAKFDADRRAGELGMGRLMDVGARVHAESGVHIPEEALPDKADLGAAVLAAFLTGGAVNTDFAAGLVKHLLQGGGGEAGGRAEEVMAAGVADPGQRVIFRQKDQRRARLFGAVDGSEAGTVTGHVRFDLEALPGQLAGKRLTGEELVVADLGLCVDIQGDLTVDAVLAVDIGKDAISV